jgi:hypothetical protein
MSLEPGSLSKTLFNGGRFYYCKLKEQVDAYGDFEKASFFLNIIRKEFPQEKRDYLRALLTIGQWDDLRRLVGIVKSGKKEQDFIWTQKVDLEQTTKQRLLINESKMAQWLLRNKQSLVKVLPISNISSLRLELELGEFGRADLMLIADRVGYPIELKDETGCERLSGQILKYIKGSICLMKLDWYDEVKGIVIAPSFTQEALNQLKQMGIETIQMSSIGESFILKKV